MRYRQPSGSRCASHPSSQSTRRAVHYSVGECAYRGEWHAGYNSFVKGPSSQFNATQINGISTITLVRKTVSPASTIFRKTQPPFHLRSAKFLGFRKQCTPVASYFPWITPPSSPEFYLGKPLRLRSGVGQCNYCPVVENPAMSVLIFLAALFSQASRFRMQTSGPRLASGGTISPGNAT